jgi:hypothetical protein
LALVRRTDEVMARMIGTLGSFDAGAGGGVAGSFGGAGGGAGGVGVGVEGAFTGAGADVEKPVWRNAVNLAVTA